MTTLTTIHRDMFDAWNRRDYEAMRELLHPEYSYTGGDGKEMTGPEVGIGIAKMYAAAFPDGVIDIQAAYTMGNVAIAEVVARGTQTGPLMEIGPTGKPVKILICNVMELKDGKVYREREYMDMLSMMTQLGVIKEPSSSAAA